MLTAGSTANGVHKLVAALRTAIVSGSQQPGGVLPSARHLARQFGVNKNTVSKAYGILVREGLLAVSRGRRATAAVTPGDPAAAEQVLRRQLRTPWLGSSGKRASSECRPSTFPVRSTRSWPPRPRR